jgi:hypothetical protein
MTSYATMAKVFVGFVATMAIVCHLGVQALDKATAEQCKTHAWSQAAHQIHMDWCAANNYKTNWSTHPPINIMAKVTYAQLFKFMGTFTNQELDDAQTIAEHAHQDLGKSYNQVLVDVLVEMRQHQLVNWSVKAGWEVQTLPQLLPPTKGGYFKHHGHP